MNKTKLLSAVISAAMAFGCMAYMPQTNVFEPVTAEAESYSDYLYFQKVDEDENGTYDYVVITGCDSSATEIVIPDEINSLPVTHIGYYAFWDRYSLTSVTIPASVTSIEGEAFYNCTSLTSIEVSENNSNYSSIDGILFNKEQTELIMYPVGKTDESYKIPETVTSIGNYTFSGCTNLKSVTIEDGVTSIGFSAFSGCTNLEIITIPASVTSIEGETFCNCTSLTSVTIEDGVTSIGFSAFAYCESLTSITIPDSVTSIEFYVFSGCTKLTNIEVSENNANYSSIDGVLFNKEQTELIMYPVGKTDESYKIPETVTNIGDSAFYYCTSLESITIENPECEIYDSENTISSTATIYGYTNSTAQAYAEKYGYAFESFGEAPVITTPAVTTTVTTTTTTVTTQTSISETETTSTETTVEITTETTQTSVSETEIITETTTAGVTTPELTTGDVTETTTVTSETTTTTTEPTEIIKGDANGDGEVSVRDASTIARFLAEKRTDELLLSADFNDDGKVDVRDAAAIARWLAKGGK